MKAKYLDSDQGRSELTVLAASTSNYLSRRCYKANVKLHLVAQSLLSQRLSVAITKRCSSPDSTTLQSSRSKQSWTISSSHPNQLMHPKAVVALYRRSNSSTLDQHLEARKRGSPKWINSVRCWASRSHSLDVTTRWTLHSQTVWLGKACQWMLSTHDHKTCVLRWSSLVLIMELPLLHKDLAAYWNNDSSIIY